MFAQPNFLDGLLGLRKFSSIVGDTLLLDWYTRLVRSRVNSPIELGWRFGLLTNLCFKKSHDVLHLHIGINVQRI